LQDFHTVVKLITDNFWRCIIVNILLEKERTKKEGLIFKEPEVDDGAEMFRIAKDSKVLDMNSSYCYLMWSKFFNKTSIIAYEGEKAVGFVSGFIQPESEDTLFIWQIAINSDYRGRGIATKLVTKLLKQLKNEKIRFLEATVTRSNLASSNLFKGIAEKFNTKYDIKKCFSKEHFPDESSEAEFTYRIGPFQRLT